MPIPADGNAIKTNKMKSYKLIPFGRGDAAAALCKVCSEGSIGEPLLREGFSKRRFCEFIAKLVMDRQAAGKNPVEALMLVDCSNMSAARQALSDCSIQFEQLDENEESIIDKDGNPSWEKAQSVGKYWESIGGAKPRADLSALD